MNPLLIILNPRAITECINSFQDLEGIDLAWLIGYSERDLVPIMAALIESTDYSHYIVCSDDVIVQQPALYAVLELLSDYPVATGWCNLDSTKASVNLTKSPLKLSQPAPLAYDFYHWAEILRWPHASRAIPTWFAGMCLTGMRRELWQQFPFACYGSEFLGSGGYASDYSLSWRLQEAEIPIVAARDGFVYHVKETWNSSDRDPAKQLLIGKVKPEVRMDLYERCGAQDWAYDDDEKPFAYGTCQLHKGHSDRYHREMREGKLWAEWSGPADSRMPAS